MEITTEKMMRVVKWNDITFGAMNIFEEDKIALLERVPFSGDGTMEHVPLGAI